MHTVQGMAQPKTFFLSLLSSYKLKILTGDAKLAVLSAQRDCCHVTKHPLHKPEPLGLLMLMLKRVALR